MSSFDPTTTSIDYALVAGQRTPGILDIVGANSPRNWDKRKGYGLAGATVFFTGLDLSEFSLKCRLYTSQDWSDWDRFRTVISARPITQSNDGLFRTKALSIWHPWLEQLGIHAVVVKDILQPVQTGDGEWTIEIKVIQFRQPKPQYAKPTATKAEPTDPVEQRIKELAENNRQLMSKLSQELAR